MTAVAERILLAAAAAMLALVGAYACMAWLYGELLAKGVLQAAGIAGMIGGPAIWIGNHRRRVRRQEITLARAEREAKYKLHNGRDVVAVDMSGPRPDFIMMGRSAHRRPALPDPADAMAPPAAPALLPAVRSADSMLVWGGKGAGKTNLLQHLAAEKIAAGEQLWIVDPKPGRPGKWPDGARVIGQGHDYDAIRAIGRRYLEELETRKDMYARVAAYPKITAIVDESLVLNMQIRGWMDMILPLLLEGREYNIHLILISQSKTAKSIGLEGRYDIMESFDVIVGLRKIGADHCAWVDFGDGEDVRHQPPPPYLSRPGVPPLGAGVPAGTRAGTPGRDAGTGPPRLGMDHGEGWRPPDVRGPFFEGREQAEIWRRKAAGESWKATCKAVWGFSNGRKIAEAKKIYRSISDS